MSLANLLTDAKIVKIDNGHVAGTSLVTSSTFDMAGFDAVMIIADFATITDASVLTLQLQNGANSGGSDAANISGASVTLTASGNSNGQMVLDCIQPGIGGNKRYCTVTLTRSTQNAVVNSITAILYRARTKPTVQPSTILASATVECAGLTMMP